MDNTKRVFHGNDRGNRNFGPVGRGSFGRGSQKTEGRILKAMLEGLEEEYTTKIKTGTFSHSTKMEQNQQSGMLHFKHMI